MAVIAQEGGSPMGPLLRAVNRVADAIAKDYPNVAVSTAPYQFSTKPPNTTHPRTNVVIRYSTMNCDVRSTVATLRRRVSASDPFAVDSLQDHLLIRRTLCAPTKSCNGPTSALGSSSGIVSTRTVKPLERLRLPQVSHRYNHCYVQIKPTFRITSSLFQIGSKLARI
jgi:hypothetical protein